MAARSSGDVVVVGGGVIGLSIAWRLASRGAQVTLVDPAPGRATSWSAAGMLAPVTEVHYGEEALLALNRASLERWEGFAGQLERETGLHVGYRSTGTVVVARDADDNRQLDHLHAFQSRLGLEAQRLRGRELRSLEPGLTPSVRGGILVTGDHQVDNRALVEALVAACAATGVTFVDGVATGLTANGSVRLRDGAELTGGSVVLSAGWRTGALGGLPGGPLPVRPVKGQLLHLREPSGAPALIERVVRGLEVYLVPRGDGRIVVGATVEERGEDTTTTAGGVLALLHAAWELVPGIDECVLTETVAGLRPGTPDNAPILGALAEGLLVATGHYRNGILLAPVTADEVAALVETGTASALLEPFSPQRFAQEASWSA